MLNKPLFFMSRKIFLTLTTVLPLFSVVNHFTYEKNILDLQNQTIC